MLSFVTFHLHILYVAETISEDGTVIFAVRWHVHYSPSRSHDHAVSALALTYPIVSVVVTLKR